MLNIFNNKNINEITWQNRSCYTTEYFMRKKFNERPKHYQRVNNLNVKT